MDNKINEIIKKIRFLRSEMLLLEEAIRAEIGKDQDCSASSVRLMAMRKQLLCLIEERNALGGHERLLNVEEKLKADYRAVNRKPIKGPPARRADTQCTDVKKRDRRKPESHVQTG